MSIVSRRSFGAKRLLLPGKTTHNEYPSIELNSSVDSIFFFHVCFLLSYNKFATDRLQRHLNEVGRLTFVIGLESKYPH